MTIKLRPYQQQCVEDCIRWIKSTTSPAVIDATVSFGKSIVIAEIARQIQELSGKRVLIICPSGNLVKQNAEKLAGLGVNHSIFSASANTFSLRHPIIVGTPQTILNRITSFKRDFSAILIDEGDGITNTVKSVVSEIKDTNPLVRVLGFTGTPFRSMEGYIYRVGLDGKPVPDSQARDPYYTRLIHQTSTKHLMDEGYLTPCVVGDIGAESYDTSALVPNRSGKFSSKAVDQAYSGHGRKTSVIVGDIVSKSAGRSGVMIFGATIQHCHEIMASLPPELSRMVASGEDDNEQVIIDFKKQRFKYLVSKDMLLVGFDAPHVDVIAVMRKTESARLLTQVIGRGLRLHTLNPAPIEDTPLGRKEAIASGPKPNVLYLDYTDNIETHFPDGDIFSPTIKAAYFSEEKTTIKAECEDCGAENEFSARRNDDGLDIDEYGYFLDLEKNRIMTEHGAIPAHHGRRCQGVVRQGAEYVRCDYYWSSKECDTCQHHNDITARRCENCKAELIDPNSALIAEFKQQQKNPHLLQTDELLQMDIIPTISKAGNPMVRVEFVTSSRRFPVYLVTEHDNPYALKGYQDFMGQTENGSVKPRTVTYKKEDSGMYKVRCFNNPTDRELLLESLKKGGYVGEV